VDLTGISSHTSRFRRHRGQDANPLIQHDLKERGVLYKAETILHTYPSAGAAARRSFYYALDSWYVQTTKHKARAALQQT